MCINLDDDDDDCYYDFKTELEAVIEKLKFFLLCFNLYFYETPIYAYC